MAAPNGYHRLAEWIMGPYPETAIFRKFSPLAMLSLLSLQAELIELDDEFRRIRNEDDQSNDIKERNYSRYFRDLHMSEGSGRDQQYQMLMRIREKLNEYYAALLQAEQISKLSQPTRSELAFLRGWISSPSDGGDFLEAAESFTWDTAPNAAIFEKGHLYRDLVSLYARPSEQDPDPSSEFVTPRLIWLYSWLWGARRSGGEQGGALGEYKTTLLFRMISSVLVSVLSSMMPVVSIVVLYYIKSTINRIGALVGFTTLFAFVLARFTNARRLEIFATTSTFAAVEVVFIGTTLQKD